MPPFFVEEPKADAIDWLYGAAGDLQVLSGCPNGATAGFLGQITEQRNELRAFDPDSSFSTQACRRPSSSSRGR